MTERPDILPSIHEVSALILAAGVGLRIGGRPKAFLQTGGRTLLERAVLAVEGFAGEIIVGAPVGQLARARRLVERTGVTVIAGGATRYQTFAALLERATRTFVLLHEVARPMATSGIMFSTLVGARSAGAAAPCVPASVRDAVALSNGDYYSEPLQRDHVVCMQSPQAFDRSLLLDVVAKTPDESWESASIPAVIARAGKRVLLVPGNMENLKITFPEDWHLARRLLRKRENIAK